MTAVWPSGQIPLRALQSSYAEQPENNRLKYEPELGPPKLRRRSTVRADTISFETHMTQAQYDALMTFYTADLENGTLTFTRQHPRTFAADVEFMFSAPPTFAVLGGNLYRVTLSLLKLP